MVYKTLIILGIALILLVVQDSTEGKPGGHYRRKRFIENQYDGPDYNLNEIEDNDIDTGEENREVRRSPGYGGYQTTYPPFPGDEDDYDRYIAKSTTREPSTTPYYYVTPTSTEIAFDRSYEESERKNEDESEPLHKKVVPWLKRQWGHTRGFFKKHYENLANQVG